MVELKLSKMKVAILFVAIMLINGGNLRREETDKTNEVPLNEPLKNYYFNQFKEGSLQQKFYKAMKYMHTEKLFQKGTESIDVVVKGYFNQSDIDENAMNSMDLVYAMGAARDAFVLDYPEIFYVNFEKLSVRILSKRVNNKDVPVCLLGTGREDNYFADGFSSENDVNTAITEYQNNINTVITGFKTNADIEEKIKLAHNYIVENMEYKLEIDSGVKDIKTLRSVYGGIKNKQGMCETYAKLFKVFMDNLNIPCISVIGKTYDQGNTEEGNPHMWNNVYLKKSTLNGTYWFAVDTTYSQGKKTSSYLLAEKSVMSYHIADKYLSEAKYPFDYPTLYGRINTIEDTSGFKAVLKYIDEFESEGYEVSYLDYGAMFNKDINNYILVRYKSNTDESFNQWSYCYLFYSSFDHETYFNLPLANLQFSYIQFGLTNIPYTDTYPIGGYTGSNDKIIKISNVYENPHASTYIPPPFAYKNIPSTSSKINSGQTFDVTSFFDEDLEIYDDFKLKISTSGNVVLSDTKYENLEFIPPRTIKFRFTSSKKYAANSNTHTIDFKGIRGVISKREPNGIGYFVLNPTNIGCPLLYGQTYNSYGTVQLMENADLSTKGWTNEDGESVTNDLSVGVALVVSKPNSTEENTYSEKIKEKSPNSELVTSSTYNIKLTLCCCQMKRLPYGQRLKIMLPFPEGYGPEDAGINFSAFHYNKEKQEMEEVDCMINEYGIVIFVQEFSPFTVAVIKNNNVDNKKEVLSITNEGGKVDKDYVKLEKSGDVASFTYTPSTGYEIDYVTLNGEKINVENNKINLDYTSLPKKSNELKGYFIKSTVKAKEESKGYSIIIPSPNTPDNVLEQKGLSLVSTIKEESGKMGTLVYSWYKNDKLVIQNTENTYNLQSNETGNFKVKVSNSVAGASKTATSNIVTVEETVVPTNSTNISQVLNSTNNTNSSSPNGSSFISFSLLTLFFGLLTF